MEIGDLYQFVLMLVLVGLILGVGTLTLGKFAATAGISTAAKWAILNASVAMQPIATSWMPLIVTVGVLAIILTLVIRSFAFKR